MNPPATPATSSPAQRCPHAESGVLILRRKPLVSRPADYVQRDRSKPPPRPWFADLSEDECLRHLQALDDDQLVPAPRRGNRKPLVFRERDITRAIAGHLKAGLSVAGTKIDKAGTITVLTGQPERIDLAPNETSAQLLKLIR